MASADTTNDAVIERSASDPNFQNRVYRRFLNAAVSVMSETVQATTSGATSAAPTLTFASQPAGIAVGWSVQSLSNPASIPANTFVKTLGAAVTINNSVTVASGDIILFSPPNHQARAQFAGALFSNGVNRQVLAMTILANATNQTNCLADPTVAGGNVLDSDIDFTITSDFTGIATSRGW